MNLVGFWDTNGSHNRDQKIRLILIINKKEFVTNGILPGENQRKQKWYLDLTRKKIWYTGVTVITIVFHALERSLKAGKTNWKNWKSEEGLRPSKPQHYDEWLESSEEA